MGGGQHPVSAWLYQRLIMNPAHGAGTEAQGITAVSGTDRGAAVARTGCLGSDLPPMVILSQAQTCGGNCHD